MTLYRNGTAEEKGAFYQTPSIQFNVSNIRAIRDF